MNKDAADTSDIHGRAVRVLGVLVVSLVAAGLATPAVFNGLLWIGRSAPSLERFRDVEFEKVFSRMVLLALLVTLAAGLKLAGIRGLRALGFAREGGAWRAMAWGWVAGGLGMALVFAAGWGLGAYEAGAEEGALGKVAAYFAGALAVGLVEEALFRGALFGGLRRWLGFWGGAVTSSAVFAVVHFARPQPSSGVVCARWYSGFGMVPHMFRDLASAYHVFPMVLTLFLLGFVLCAFYQRFGSLYFAIGLHAGIVWVMKSGMYLLDREPRQLARVFGPDMDVTRGYAALVMAAVFAAAGVLALGTGRRGRAAGGGA